MGPGASELNVANSPFVAARDALAVTLRPRNLTEKARLNAGLVLTYRATAGGVRDRLVWAYQLPSCQQGGGRFCTWNDEKSASQANKNCLTFHFLVNYNSRRHQLEPF